MKRKSSLFWVFLMCVVLVGALAIITGSIIVKAIRGNHRGEITVYGINGIVAHYDDAEYKKVKDMVIVYDGDTELRYINCNVEVKE